MRSLPPINKLICLYFNSGTSEIYMVIHIWAKTVNMESYLHIVCLAFDVRSGYSMSRVFHIFSIKIQSRMLQLCEELLGTSRKFSELDQTISNSTNIGGFFTGIEPRAAA